ncbi:MAG: 7-carboxy-7-deazaguanine synthase [Myxococcota bacterium]|jgi:7-carboxy-7-deazaguanine synthase
MGDPVKLFISETFTSIQGEGLLTGVPSVFLRTSGCNLRCRWCDTPYTSWRATGTHQTVEELVSIVEASPARHVVLTGGEPMLQKGIEPLCATLSGLGYHITIETAGTLFRPVAVDLLSISPKLADSTPDESTPDAAAGLIARHERDRLSLPVLRQLIAHADHQLKFVASSEADIEEVAAVVEALGVAADRVLLMPEGRTVEEIDAHLPLLIPACTARGWRLCDRLHLRLFGNTPGT